MIASHPSCISPIQCRSEINFNWPIHRGSAVLCAMLLISLTTVCIADDADDSPVAKRSAAEVSEGDRLAYARKLEQAASETDRDRVNNLMDWAALVEIATAGDQSSKVAPLREVFKKSFVAATQKPSPTGFADFLVNTVKDAGTVKFLHFAEFENQPAVLFRVKSATHAVSYLYFFLNRSPDGVVRAYDCYWLVSADRLTDSVRRVWLPTIDGATKSLWERIITTPDPVLAGLAPVTKMRTLTADGKADEALALFDKLPEPVKALKYVQMARINAGQLVSIEQYEVIMDDFRKQFPDEPALEFLLVDGYVLKEQYDKCLTCIDSFNERIGGDPWLVALRANCLAELGRPDEAIEAANAAIVMEPEFEDIHVIALSVAVKTKNNKEIARHLTLLEDDFDNEIDDLTQIPDYDDFVRSPEYEKWMESRK